MGAATMLHSSAILHRQILVTLGVAFAWFPMSGDAFCGDTAAPVSDIRHCVLGEGGRHVIVGSIELPADGLWQIQTDELPISVRESYLVPQDTARLRQLGKRMYAALEDRIIQAGQWQTQRGYGLCRQYAIDHNHVGPPSLKAIYEENDATQSMSGSWDRMSWRIRDLEHMISKESIEGPFIHLIPNVDFKFSEQAVTESPLSKRLVVPKELRKVLAFQLRPLIDDGKHWVLYTDGACERAEIDRELVEKQHAKIRPILSGSEFEGADRREMVSYTIVIISDERLQSVSDIKIANSILQQSSLARLDVTVVKESNTDDIAPLVRQARQFAWQPYVLAGSGGILDVWNHTQTTEQDPNPRRSLSMFSILGGRAAIEETLQLQNLNVRTKASAGSVDLNSIKGVEVESHPFEEMLAGTEGGHLELASFVPHDRFFIYIGKPDSLPALFDTGAPFIASLGTMMSGNCLQYNLEARYLDRLGVNRDWVDAVLSSGMIEEMSVFTPDLFFIDGTDVTVVARLKQPALLRRMLSMLGVTAGSTEELVKLPTSGDQPAFASLRGDLLFLSSNQHELRRALELQQNGGEGSLGASVEFRYMLTQLPVADQTRLYAYLSDPFVRRLVGPETKIGQRRRILAKARMEAITAKGLQARLDGLTDVHSVDALARHGYLPSDWHSAGGQNDSRANASHEILPSGIVRSEHYGTLPRMKTLRDVPIEKITPEEAEAYESYRENYSRYWRQFFDPIAIRLNDTAPGELELSTFILPLVDNSIYNGLRQVLAHQDDQQFLSVPIVEPTPVLKFSMNLREQAWQQIAGNFSDFFAHYSGVSSAMLDDLGPSVHLAVFDSDPIIAVGSGDVFGAFGGNVIRGGNSMTMVPVMLSMLTRPCSIIVETKDPERTAQYLRQAALARSMGRASNNGFATSFYQEDDDDRWVWVMDIMGMVKLRYGIEISDHYMVIRNIPWSSDDRVVRSEPVDLNASYLQLNPVACRLQLPGLHAAAADANRRAVMSGMGRLYPLMLAGSDSLESAMAEHQRLFGFHPRQLQGDRWRWENQRLVSDAFGHPVQQRQPRYQPDQPFGLMNRIESIQLNMQFESDGLRSNVRWRLK